MMKNMCVEAGIHRKTNHSLHASSVTTLFQKNVPATNLRGPTFKLLCEHTATLYLSLLKTFYEPQYMIGMILSESLINKCVVTDHLIL